MKECIRAMDFIVLSISLMSKLWMSKTCISAIIEFSNSPNVWGSRHLGWKDSKAWQLFSRRGVILLCVTGSRLPWVSLRLQVSRPWFSSSAFDPQGSSHNVYNMVKGLSILSCLQRKQVCGKMMKSKGNMYDLIVILFLRSVLSYLSSYLVRFLFFSFSEARVFLCNPGCCGTCYGGQTDKESPASAFQLLGWKSCAITPCHTPELLLYSWILFGGKKKIFMSVLLLATFSLHHEWEIYHFSIFW